jgi:serine/threonine-protein kinase RsbW
VKKRYQLASDLANVQKASTDLLGFLKPLGLSDAVQFDIRLCLEEALVNAMKYGNGLKKEMPVELEVEGSPKEVRITVEDRGPGFDVDKLPDCTTDENIYSGHGRGVYLMRKLMDVVSYNDKGNKLLMVKTLKK